MFDGVIHRAQDAAARSARKAALGLGASLCLAVGAGFLTVAAWLFITTLTSAMNAALIIGGVYMGVGFILIGVMSSKDTTKTAPRHGTTPQSSDADMGPKIVEAFMTGVRAGQNARS